MKKEKFIKVGGQEINRMAWRMTKVAISSLLWVFSMFPISVYFYFNLPLKKWFPSLWVQFPASLAVFISVIIIGYLIVYFSISIVAWLIMNRYLKKK